MAGTSWGGGGVTLLLLLREQTSWCDEGVKRETGSKNCSKSSTSVWKAGNFGNARNGGQFRKGETQNPKRATNLTKASKKPKHCTADVCLAVNFQQTPFGVRVSLRDAHLANRFWF
jgi:hypothetical protein